MKRIWTILIAANLALVACLFIITGCRAPSPFLFTPYTNVISETAAPYRTNVVTIYATNPVTQVVVTNTISRVIWQTNTIVEVGVAPSTNAAGIASGVGGVSGVLLPGSSGFVEAGILGILALAGGFWRHRIVVQRLSDDSDAQVEAQKSTAANIAKALTYTVENYRDVLLKLPNGEAMDTKLMHEAQKAQTALNVGALVADIVKTYVRDPDVQAASAKVAEEARRLAGTQ